VKNFFTALCFFLAGQGIALADADFRSVRLWAAPDHTRVVFDTSGPVTHDIFTLENPARLVIDVPAAKVGASTLTASGGLVSGIRTAQNKPDVLRIVLDLKQSVKPRSFSLTPNDQYGHRLVVDLYEATSDKTVKQAAKPVISQQRASQPAQLRDLVIAIDAGHGGEDPGAIGRRKTREKDVVFAIAKRLARLVEKEPGMRPVMIREGDYYIGLRQRIEKARRHKADLFISIHADAFRDRRAHGSSVYTRTTCCARCCWTCPRPPRGKPVSVSPTTCWASSGAWARHTSRAYSRPVSWC
jgi:N-acetylmuramoyl-L-alanine amidase